MKNIRKKLIISLAALSLISILYILSITKKDTTHLDAPSPTPISTFNPNANLKSIQIGTSDIDKVNELLGNPIKTEVKDEKLISEYETSSKFRNHVVEFENNKAILVKEMVNEIRPNYADKIRSEYGNASSILYSNDPTAVFDLYVYPEAGVAYLGSEDGVVLEIWYFPSTDIDTFMSEWGQDYSTSKSNIKRH